MDYSRNASDISKVFFIFFITLMVSALGVLIGTFIPPALFLPLVIVEIGMLLVAFFIRKRNIVGYKFLYIFTFISGMTLFPTISYYVGTIGANLVFTAIIITTLTFASLSVYAMKSKTDFSYLGGFLFGGLIALILVGIVGIFFPLGGVINYVYTLFGILIFMGYILYDVSRITHHGVDEDMIPSVVLSLYLDFINLLLFILRLFGLTSSNKD